MVLFTGDADGKDIAAGLNNRSTLLSPHTDRKFIMDVMNVPHHGSGKNNFKELLDVCRAELYIVSTNGEAHGHPHDEVLELLCNEIRSHSARVHYSYKECAKKLKNMLND